MIFVKIKRDDLIEALSTNIDSLGGGWFLDTETGAVLLDSDAIDDLPEDLGDNPRYLAIYPIPSHESFRVMENFVANLGDTKDARRLADALNRPKPFRRFKDTLCDYTELREAWFAFERVASMKCNGIEESEASTILDSTALHRGYLLIGLHMAVGWVRRTKQITPKLPTGLSVRRNPTLGGNSTPKRWVYPQGIKRRA